MNEQTRPVGRPSKGERDAIMAKPPLDFGKLLREKAKELGYESNGDYIVALCAEALNLPEYSPAPKAPEGTNQVRHIRSSKEARPRAA